MNPCFLFSLLMIAAPIKQGNASEADDSLTATALPEAGTVIRRMIERAGMNMTNQHVAATVYFRTNITEEYTSQGEVKERKESVKKITHRAGERTSELIQFNGAPPTEKEIEQEARKKERRDSGDDDKETPDRSKQIDDYMTADILSRFIFTVHGRDVLEGRSCLLVGFKPGNDPERSTKMLDRIIDQMGGMIWIDDEEYEMVKADIQLRERVKMWGGILAALDQIKLKIQRTRADTGIWYDRTVEARFSGRALTKRIEIMTWDFSSKPLPLREPENDDSIVAAQQKTGIDTQHN